MRNLVILGGSSHPNLTAAICRNLCIDQGQAELKKFSNGETSVMIKNSVREKDVYIIQSGCGDVNDNFVELLIMISACKTASAAKVTAVLPLFPYSRQPDIPYTKSGAPLTGRPASSSTTQFSFDSVPGTPKARYEKSQPSTPSLLASVNKKFEWSPNTEVKETNTGYKEWVAQSGNLVASLLTCAGADHIITMDLHDPQFQGYFDIPVDNLYGKPILQHYIATGIPDFQNAVLVSPDAGGAKRATSLADALGMPFALIHKERGSVRSGNRKPIKLGNGYHATTMLVGDVRDRVAVLVDDMVDTANTITRAAKLLKDCGALKVYAVITHCVLSGDAVTRIKMSAVDQLVTTNSTPQQEHLRQLGEDRLKVLDVSRVFGEAIRRIHNGESVSMLFDHMT